MSSVAESNMELGYKVNLDSSRLIFDHLRNTQPGLVVVYTSSTAVYGPPEAQDQIYTEQNPPRPTILLRHAKVHDRVRFRRTINISIIVFYRCVKAYAYLSYIL